MREPARAPAPRPSAAGSTWLGWLIAVAMVPPGWIFIGHAHRWHLTPSVVVLCLAWIALVALGFALVRASNSLLDEVPDDWFAAGSTRDELEREKKSLVRAIKEIEFDRDTGKLTQLDAAQLIAVYRARAIEVIRVLDVGGGQTPRERILAELKARAVLEQKARSGKGAKPGKNGKSKPGPARPVERPAPPAVEAAPVAEAAPVEAAPVEAAPPVVEAAPIEAPPVAPPVEDRPTHNEEVAS